MDKYTRIGYTSGRQIAVLKRKDFARWQSSERLPDTAQCRAVEEMELGLVDADLGGFLFKSDKANVTQEERKALQFAGKVFLELCGSVDESAQGRRVVGGAL